MATRRSNGEGTVWYAKTEGRFRAQYPDANGHRRTITGKTKRDVEKKLRLALTSNAIVEFSLTDLEMRFLGDQKLVNDNIIEVYEN